MADVKKAVITDTAGDSEEWTGEEFDARLNSTFYVGHAAALEDAAKEAKKKAGELFAGDRDNDRHEAYVWRDKVAPWLAAKAAEYRKEQAEQDKLTYRGKKKK